MTVFGVENFSTKRPLPFTGFGIERASQTAQPVVGKSLRVAEGCPRVLIPKRLFSPSTASSPNPSVVGEAAALIPRQKRACRIEQVRIAYLASFNGEMARLEKLRATGSAWLISRCEVFEQEIRELREALSQRPKEAELAWDEIVTKTGLLRGRIFEFDKEAVSNLQKKLALPFKREAEKIFYGIFSNWESFVELDKESGLMRQIHGIKGLKVYPLPGTNTLVVDYAGNVIRRGASKRVKSMVRIGDSTAHVRLTSLAKDIVTPPTATEEERRGDQEKIRMEIDSFAMDVRNELAAREALLQIGAPNVAGITMVEYFGKKAPKVRYIMTRYPSDLWILVKKEENREKALRCCINVAESLEAMHRAGLVHGDLKPLNVLTNGEKGYLSDFGCIGIEGKVSGFGFNVLGRRHIPAPGNPTYMAPETIFGDDSVGGVCLYSSKSDMFSFAVLLLYAVSLDLAKRWCEAAGKFNERYRNGVGILSIREKKEKVTDYLKNYVALHKSLIEELEKPSTTRGAEETKLYPLISRLLDRDPNNRPSAEETLRQLRELGSP